MGMKVGERVSAESLVSWGVSAELQRIWAEAGILVSSDEGFELTQRAIWMIEAIGGGAPEARPEEPAPAPEPPRQPKAKARGRAKARAQPEATANPKPEAPAAAARQPGDAPRPASGKRLRELVVAASQLLTSREWKEMESQRIVRFKVPSQEEPLCCLFGGPDIDQPRGLMLFNGPEGLEQVFRVIGRGGFSPGDSAIMVDALAVADLSARDQRALRSALRDTIGRLPELLRFPVVISDTGDARLPTEDEAVPILWCLRGLNTALSLGIYDPEELRTTPTVDTLTVSGPPVFPNVHKHEEPLDQEELAAALLASADPDEEWWLATLPLDTPRDTPLTRALVAIDPATGPMFISRAEPGRPLAEVFKELLADAMGRPLPSIVTVLEEEPFLELLEDNTIWPFQLKFEQPDEDVIVALEHIVDELCLEFEWD